MLRADLVSPVCPQAPVAVDERPSPHLAIRREVTRQLWREPFDGRVEIRSVADHGWCPLPDVVACVPARDEADTLLACLTGLQTSLAAVPGRCAILLLANNCTDTTFRIAATEAATGRVPILAVDAVFDEAIADVGHVRRFGLECAAALAAPDAVLLSTDADTVVAADWATLLAAKVRDGSALAYGPVLSPATIAGLPARAASIAMLEQELRRVQADLWAALVPTHVQRVGLAPGGASMGVRASAYREVGGLPPLPVAEDRALSDRLIDAGHEVAFVEAAEVQTSLRMEGRVPGGMAGTLASRANADAPCDPVLLPTKRFAWLALAFRLLAGDGDSAHALLIAHKLEVPVSLLLPSKRPLSVRWARLRAAVPPGRPLSVPEARHELRAAETLVDAIKAVERRDYIETPMVLVDRSDG